MSSTAALLHIGCIYFGAPWYRFFGAGEEMAQMAEAGSWVPGLITAGSALILGIWALYALSAAGAMRRLLAILPIVVLQPQHATAFAWWSSAICLGFGVIHMVGLWQRWRPIAAESF